jgi:hypothetical protein
MSSDILIAGVFRTGTTMLANLLSEHPNALVVSDPFVYFFKHYRNYHLAAMGRTDWDPDEPTPDYFGGHRGELLARILESDFGEAMPAATLQQMVADIREWKTEQHPELCARLDEVEGQSFADVYRSLIDLSVEIYGSRHVQMAGTKVSWCEEFLPAMARAFPEMQFVVPFRDLRAVVASQNNQTGAGIGQRPLLFYVRHWRKCVALAHHFANNHSLLKGRVHLVRYEDFVGAPDEQLAALTAKLGLPARSLGVGAGRSDIGHNSSFDMDGAEAPPSQGVFRQSAERWRQVLTTDEIRAIDALAGPELRLLGYPLEHPSARPIGCLGLDCEP